MTARAILGASAGGSATPTTTYVDDVFSTYLYTGNGSTQTINNGIDLAGKGGLVWIKDRNNVANHCLVNTTSGPGWVLNSSTTTGNQDYSGLAVTAFNSNGFSLGSNGLVNAFGGHDYVSWTFRNADKFYNHSVVTKSAGSNATVSFPGLGTLGMVRVKRTDSTGSWYVWHRSLSAGKLLIGESPAAEATLGHITVSGTTVTLVNGVIANGSYVVYAWAHDTASDGLIQCGSFTTDGSGNATVNLGREPQFLIAKASGATGDWIALDTMRGWTNPDGSKSLYLNLSSTEGTRNGTYPTATGFQATGTSSLTTHIYLAIRRPNKPPTTGTQVFNAVARTGTGAAAAVTGVGFAPDVYISGARAVSSSGFVAIWDRLRGPSNRIHTYLTNVETTATDEVFSLTMDGFTTGTSAASGFTNRSSGTYINWFFRRYAGVFDQICYTGTGNNKTEAHNLGVAPEMWLVKGRSGATQWVWGSSLLANTEKIVMPSPNGKVTDATAWNSTYPTASNISLGTAAAVNTSAATYVAYLWATKAGISKVGSYTGNGSSQTINCGFTTGARFVMIIRTTASTAQDIYIWDTARGIVSGNDPHLSLNTTAAEVTTDDSIDPDTSGFIVNQVAATNINVNGASYICLAYA